MKQDAVRSIISYCQLNLDCAESIFQCLCEKNRRKVKLPDGELTLTLAQIWEFAEVYKWRIEPSLLSNGKGEKSVADKR